MLPTLNNKGRWKHNNSSWIETNTSVCRCRYMYLDLFVRSGIGFDVPIGFHLNIYHDEN